MHNLAIALKRKGIEVSGSDDEIFEPSRSRLENNGILPENIGWDAEKIHSDLDAIILGMHARKDNPELLRAQELGIKIYSYPEFVAEQCKDKTRLVIGGSHGKTTITSMILHVLHELGVKTDYLVGALLEGFDCMVQLSDAKVIVIEGDEYLSSPIDLRPKFHWYAPHVALISGIAWDHINVFPTYANYVEQFQVFVDGIVRGGSITFNAEDKEVAKVVESSENAIRKFPYSTPDYQVINGVTYLATPEGDMPVEIFGKHNLNNLAGAKWICQQMGVDEADFYEAIATFKGASKRMEKIAEGQNKIAYKDFAHSPSKVKATTNAIKEQYPSRKLIACLELHTYSSLNAEFLQEYNGALDAADVAMVFYSPKAVQIKQLDEVTSQQIAAAFQRDDILVFTDPKSFQDQLFATDFDNSALLLMSSGNYGGLNFEKVKELFC